MPVPRSYGTDCNQFQHSTTAVYRAMASGLSLSLPGFSQHSLAFLHSFRWGLSMPVSLHPSQPFATFLLRHVPRCPMSLPGFTLYSIEFFHTFHFILYLPDPSHRSQPFSVHSHCPVPLGPMLSTRILLNFSIDSLFTGPSPPIPTIFSIFLLSLCCCSYVEISVNSQGNIINIKGV